MPHVFQPLRQYVLIRSLKQPILLILARWVVLFNSIICITIRLLNDIYLGLTVTCIDVDTVAPPLAG